MAPDALPDLIFARVGRTVWADLGGVAVVFRLMMKLLVRSKRMRAGGRAANLGPRAWAWHTGAAVLRRRCFCRLTRSAHPSQDFNLMTTSLGHFAPLMGDFRRYL